MSERREEGPGGQMEQERIPDVVIASAVGRTLLTNLQFQMHPISVSVRDGVVTLRGSLDSAELRQQAAELAVSVPGVRAVNNLIDVPGERA